jgi:hypothetical protein
VNRWHTVKVRHDEFAVSLIAHLLVTLARLAKPGGLGAVVAESLAVKTPAAHWESARFWCQPNA